MRGILSAKAWGHLRGGGIGQIGLRLDLGVTEVHGQTFHWRGVRMGSRVRGHGGGCCRGRRMAHRMLLLLLLVLHLRMRWSVPFQVGELHVELKEIGEFIFSRRDERILM